MIKLLLKFENFLAMQTIYLRYPFCIYALKMQIRLHKMFPVIFADTPTNSYAENA